jgi:hypothetical protein
MVKTWRPFIAGLLLLSASIPYVLFSLDAFLNPRYLPANVGGGRVWAPVGIIIWFPFILPLWLGSTAAFLRKAWALALIGAALPIALSVMLSPWQGTSVGLAFFYVTSLPYRACQFLELLVYLWMIAAIVLAAISRQEFRGRLSAAEHLYGPPKWYRRERS